MNSPRPLVVIDDPCWQRIGVWGDQTCPELRQHTHCHNCPVFALAGRRFLDAPPPEGYSAEWAERLAVPEEETAGDLLGALVFRLGDEWLAMPVGTLVEVTHPRPVHRVPHRGGLLAGLVNIRGELHLCVRLDLLLGIDLPADSLVNRPRLIAIRRDSDGWVFSADEVDQVHRIAADELRTTPPTLSRSSSRLARGIFTRDGRAIGLLDEDRLFHSFRERVR
ncbi:MAG TPA: chemotaxis protein CheW [Urbifossiella sp.]|jgi:chemotaxis-related protein WspD